MKQEERKALQSNLWKFNVLNIFNSLLFVVPIIVLFWQQNGLSLTQIMVLQSIFAIVTVVLEIPTGYFADIFGRKKSIVLGITMYTIGVIAYSVSFNFWHFLIAELFFGFGIAFISGANVALIYDSLKELKQESKYKHVWGNIMFYGLIAMAFAQMAGGFIAKISYRMTVIISIPLMIIAIPFALSLHEPKRHKRIFKKGYTYELFQVMKEYLWKNKAVAALILFFAFITAFNNSGLWLFQPYFQITGLDIAFFGIVFASYQLFSAFSSKWAGKFEEKIGMKLSLVLMVVLSGLGYFLLGNVVFIFSFVFVFLLQITRGQINVLNSGYINKYIKSDVRATVLSAQSMATKLVYALILPFIGFSADTIGIVHTFKIIAACIIFGGILLLILLKKRKVI